MSVIPIKHLASMARSGETLVLRTLNAHSQIHAPWQIGRRDSPPAVRLVEDIRQEGLASLDTESDLAHGIATDGVKVLLIKQGIWEHRHPFEGIIVVRNPVSIFASLLVYDRFRLNGDYLRALAKSLILHQTTDTNTERFVRWMKDIDSKLVDDMHKRNKVERFCLFYNRRMGALRRLKLPVFHYENIVTSPKHYFSKMCEHLGVSFEEGMLKAHTGFKARKGHGGIDLNRPVNEVSNTKYQSILTKEQFSQIAELTRPTWEAYGYSLDWEEIIVELD